jgi:tetratricopeptide (TPR) repeat protein
MGVDDSGTLAALKAHRRELIDPKIAEHDGRIVKGTGDGLLLEFSSVVDAVRCAVDVQRGMAERNQGVAADKRLEFRIGINVGDIIIDGDDIFGDGVNVAARLEALAAPGGICVSRVVRDQVLDKLSFAFDDLGAQEVKNIARPVEVFRVAFEPGARGATPAVVAKRPMRASRVRAAFVAVVVLALAGASSLVVFYFVPPSKVVPYSAQDRRMTFAVLPFTAPAGDEGAAKAAAAMTETTTAMQETRKRWAVVAPRAGVAKAVAEHAATRDIAKALDVHYLIRGNVSRAANGYSAEVLVVDPATDRVLATRTVAIDVNTLAPKRRGELDGALGALTYAALGSEVDRARDKPNDALDVRDLAFRAYIDWGRLEGKQGYDTAMQLLSRALALDPNDALALFLTAKVNLCDCVQGWSKDTAEQQRIGADALEKSLRREPDSISGLAMKVDLLTVRGQYEEALTVADTILKRDPDDLEGLSGKAYLLLRLGRPREALTYAETAVSLNDHPDQVALRAAIRYALGDDEGAAKDAQRAVARMPRDALINPAQGTVMLTLAAAEARRGQPARAKKALGEFNAAAPGVDTITAIKDWVRPTAPLAAYEPLYDGLRQAGVRD